MNIGYNEVQVFVCHKKISRGMICGASAFLPWYIFTRGKNFGYNYDIVIKPIFSMARSKLVTNFKFMWHN